jgi:hypothetical protein
VEKKLHAASSAFVAVDADIRHPDGRRTEQRPNVFQPAETAGPLELSGGDDDRRFLVDRTGQIDVVPYDALLVVEEETK